MGQPDSRSGKTLTARGTPVTSELQQQTTTIHSDQPQEGTFQWTKQWYPVAVAEFLDPSCPHAIQLLGKDLVLWRDGTGQWRCFEDACPHRLVPLSEGRIEADGTLLCAYHAWRFDGEGRCTHIPQSKDAQTEAKNRAQPQACAIAYPVQMHHGLVWVWAEAGAQAEQESQQRSPRLVPELDAASDTVVKGFWNIRDLPYGWDFFLENVSDPAHVPVSHHGLVGNRYRDPRYYDMFSTRNISTQEGFAFGITPTISGITEVIHDFQPPCLMKISTTFTDEGQNILILYATPTRPGWCRHIGCQLLVRNRVGKMPKGLAFFALPMPVWAGHVLASLFLHQDLVFLHHQERILAKRLHEPVQAEPDRWLNAVYTPNPQDKMVIAFRQWLTHRAGGGIPWAGHSLLPTTELDQRQLFDVWGTHTQHCHVCQKGLKRIERLTLVLFGAAIVCFGLGILLDARAIAIQTALNPNTASVPLLTPPGSGFWLAVIMAILLATAGYFLKKFSRLFYIYEFHHARNP